jgi:hypothetical protein
LSFPLAYYYDEKFNRENQIRKLQKMFPTSYEEIDNEDELFEKKEDITT